MSTTKMLSNKPANYTHLFPQSESLPLAYTFYMHIAYYFLSSNHVNKMLKMYVLPFANSVHLRPFKH